MSFPYKTALITDATSWIGYASADRPIANGVFIVAVGRRADRLEQMLSKHGSLKIATEVCNVSDVDGIESWVREMTIKLPKLDCLILNAGVQNTFDITPALLKTAKNELNLDYHSPLVTTTHILPHFESLSTPTAVISVTSGLAIMPMPRCANYYTSKAAFRSLTWSLRAQLTDRGARARNIRVIEAVPSVVKTELLHTRQADLVAAGRADVGMPL
ncbi:short-chain dehydrogenase/reductase SDR [Colletotrichum fioriniae PJ7]|uniref:Short-chain dehydrogenase/reductase SDR n=1 Tax=Colletotrichum fioriniae PJ7 TaxID=1445577 RepID=A0A010PZZ7_9PEZI|nr:short-chain dehydrogenase/reductase SDR [Colletotrichum fioriniae PJ7]